MIENILDTPIHSWLEPKEGENPIVLSSRIRLARNFKDIPFTNLGRIAAFEKVEKMMRGILPELKKVTKQEFGNIGLEQLSEVERNVLTEKHLISPMLSDNPKHRGVVINKAGSISIMVNEEDHLRIQSMQSGLHLKEAYKIAKEIDDAIESKYDYAFSEKYGYLTACPTNVGTGLRASVMVHLPALTLSKKINRIVRGIIRLGYTVRGLYGEGSSSVGNMFQISNQVTMGVSEDETIKKLETVVNQLVKEEMNCRKELLAQDKIGLEDKVYRAYGILKNARKLTGDEALVYLSELQLGIDLGIIAKVKDASFNKLVVVTRRNFLQKYAGKDSMTTLERDVYRAQVVRDYLK